MQERATVLAEERRAVDIEHEIALLSGERDWSDQGGGVAAGQRDEALARNIGAAAVAGGAPAEGLTVAGGTDFHPISDPPLGEVRRRRERAAHGAREAVPRGPLSRFATAPPTGERLCANR